MGEGLVGQCALEKSSASWSPTFRKDYIKISSSLGEATPLSIVVLPVLFEGEVRAVVELASFRQFTDIHLAFLDQLTQSHRHRAEYHRRHHADRTTAEAEPGAGRTAAEDQRRTAGESAACWPSRRPKSKPRIAKWSRPSGAGRKGRTAGAHLEVQERVPGQHEPRAAHAAQQPADPGADAGGEHRKQPDAEAGQVRRDHSLIRHRPAGADQRHSGS